MPVSRLGRGGTLCFLIRRSAGGEIHPFTTAAGRFSLVDDRCAVSAGALLAQAVAWLIKETRLRPVCGAMSLGADNGQGFFV